MPYLYCDLHGCAVCDLADVVREECDVNPLGCSFCYRCSLFGEVIPMPDPCDSCPHPLDSPACAECPFNEDNW